MYIIFVLLQTVSSISNLPNDSKCSDKRYFVLKLYVNQSHRVDDMMYVFTVIQTQRDGYNV